jgi:hypothetical protein
MAQNQKGENPTEFEVVNADDIQFVKRGRKSNANPALIEALKGLKKGQALVVSNMKADPKSENYGTEKSRISSQIRTACRQANLTGFRILWTPTGVPQVVA